MSFTPYPKQTNIILLAGVPLSPDYENTVKFTTLAEQQQAFQNVTIKRVYSANSYQRSGSGRLRIAELADNLYRYNYLMFENYTSGESPNYSDKWFYCFITDIIYINDHTTEIVYEIDVMQTFMFDYVLGMCYVEREHTLTDYMGEHIVEEKIDIPECIMQNYTNKFMLDEDRDLMRVYFYYVPNDEIISSLPQDLDQLGYPVTSISTITPWDESYCYYSDGNYIGTAWTFLYYDNRSPNTTKNNISKVIQKLIDIEAQIVSIEIRPRINPFYNGFTYAPATSFRDTYGTSYTPKNKKLYTYPYRYISVTNHQGGWINYKLEDFSTGTTETAVPTLSFNVEETALPTYSLYLYPDSVDYYKPWIENGISVSNTRFVQWNEDSFSKWWEQNKTSYVTGIASQIINSGISIVGASQGALYANALYTRSGANGNSTKAYIHAQQGVAASQLTEASVGAGILEGIMSDISAYSSAKNTPDNLGGNLSNSPILNKLNSVGFTVYDMGLRGRDAKIVDDFFTKYGYSIKRVKIPNIESSPVQNLRPHWNYIKTIGAELSYDYVPANYAEQIKKIYDNGITFWMSLSEVGDYSRDNSPR